MLFVNAFPVRALKVKWCLYMLVLIIFDTYDELAWGNIHVAGDHRRECS